MPATVHGGSLGRWFEELCRIRHQTLRGVVSPDRRRLPAGNLPGHGGVYAFWWTGDAKLLNATEQNHELTLVGPGGRHVSIRVDDEWLGLSTALPIPLYVGKSSVGIRKRVCQHLMLGKQRILPLGGGALKGRAPTTTCQLRAGIERIFSTYQNTRDLILDNVGLSYVALDGDDHAVNRFYLENLAIGMFRPVFNLDIEH